MFICIDWCRQKLISKVNRFEFMDMKYESYEITKLSYVRTFHISYPLKFINILQALLPQSSSTIPLSSAHHFCDKPKLYY